MKTLRRKLGDKGEDLAVEYLRNNGFTIVERNFSVRSGEIDIIAKKNDELIFVEVKSRKSKMFGEAIEALTHQKAERIFSAINTYLMKKRIPEKIAWRADAITVDFSEYPPKIEYYENPFY